MSRGGLVCVGTLLLTCLATIVLGADDELAESKRHPELVPFFPPLGNLEPFPCWPFGCCSPSHEPTGPAAPETLSPEEQRRLDDVLQAWARRSESILRYRCTFKRWEYDPVFGPRDTFKTYSEGVIKYAAPDKGVFRIEEYLDGTAGGNPATSPTSSRVKMDSNTGSAMAGGCTNWIRISGESHSANYPRKFVRQRRQRVASLSCSALLSKSSGNATGSACCQSPIVSTASIG